MSPPFADSVAPIRDAAFDQRLSFSRVVSLWSVFALTLRQHLHGKRWMVIAGLCLLCVGLVIVVRVTNPDVAPITLEFYFAFGLIPQAVLPLLALVYASGIVQDEQEEQTMTYLLIRPIPKWALYSLKLLATLITTIILTVGLTFLTYAAVYVGTETPAREVFSRALEASSIHTLAVVTYCCVFGLIGMMTKRALIVGILYAGFFEVFLANMPFSLRMATVIYHTRLIAYRSMKFLAPTPGRPDSPTDLAADFWQFDVKSDPRLLDHPQMRTSLIVLLATSAVCAVLAAILFSVREFYVKTPEKS
jgi:ABC-2 type transport system permease protein